MIKLYKYRLKALRADIGTPEWHKAKANIRAYHGDIIGTLMHSISAFMKRLAKEFEQLIKEALGRISWDA